MQCDKVIRELAVPTDDRDSAGLDRASGTMSVMRHMGGQRRTIRSSLGSNPASGTRK